MPAMKLVAEGVCVGVKQQGWGNNSWKCVRTTEFYELAE